MNKTGDLVYLPSDAPILSNDGGAWSVLYSERPGYYVVCEQKEEPTRFGDRDVTTIIYNGDTAWVMNKHIKKEF